MMSEIKAFRNLIRQTVNDVLAAETDKALATGYLRKRAVMRGLDLIIRNVDIPYVPEWLERRITRPILRKLLSALIDVLIEVVNKIGWDAFCATSLPLEET